MPDARIETRDGCTLVFGPLGIDQLGRLPRQGGPDDVLSPDLAHLVGASFAFGSQVAIDALISRVRAEKLAAPRPSYLDGLEPAAQDWAIAGEVGLSSATIFAWMTNRKLGLHGSLPVADMPIDYPHDPSDLRRCRLLLEAVPSFADRFAEVMSEVSPAWAKLVEWWPVLCNTMDSECLDWRTPSGYVVCHDTYGVMRLILQSVEGNGSGRRA